jgi:hypothetical protein
MITVRKSDSWTDNGVGTRQVREISAATLKICEVSDLMEDRKSAARHGQDQGKWLHGPVPGADFVRRHCQV